MLWEMMGVSESRARLYTLQDAKPLPPMIANSAGAQLFWAVISGIPNFTLVEEMKRDDPHFDFFSLRRELPHLSWQEDWDLQGVQAKGFSFVPCWISSCMTPRMLEFGF